MPPRTRFHSARQAPVESPTPERQRSRGFLSMLVRHDYSQLTRRPASGEPGVSPHQAEMEGSISHAPCNRKNRDFAGKTVRRNTTLHHIGVTLKLRLNTYSLPRSRRC